MRPTPGSINIPVAKFPSTPQPKNVDAQKVAGDFVESLNAALKSNNYKALSDLFVEDGYWRDHLALTWGFRTVQSPSKIHDFLKTSATSKDGFRLKSISLDTSTPVRTPSFQSLDGGAGKAFCVGLFFQLATSIGAGRGLARLVFDGQHWKAFSLYTRLEELKGHEEHTYERRPRGVEHGGKPGRKNWAQRRVEEAELKGNQEPTVIIIGGCLIDDLFIRCS